MIVGGRIARPVSAADAEAVPPLTVNVAFAGTFSAMLARLNEMLRAVVPPAASVPEAGDTAKGDPVLAPHDTGWPPGFESVTVSVLAVVPKSIVVVDNAN